MSSSATSGKPGFSACLDSSHLLFDFSRLPSFGGTSPEMSSVPYQCLRKFKIRNSLLRECIAEFIGTFILILYGSAGFAGSVLEGKKIPDVFGATWVWGVGVILGVTSAFGVSGGHINPAVTTAFATLGKFPWRKVPAYILSQHLGGFMAAVILYCAFYDALNLFDPNRTVEGQNATAYIFTTFPRENIGIGNCFVSELILGALIMFCFSAIIDSHNLVPKHMWPLLFGFVIQTTAQAFGLNCISPINPARDFPTRVFLAIAGWGKEAFSVRNYAYWWIGIVGPHVGYMIGGWFYYLALEIHWPEQDDEEEDPGREMMLKEGKNAPRKNKTSS